MPNQFPYRLQFGLRTFFVLITATIVTLVISLGIAQKKYLGYRQRQAILALRLSNAHILHQYERGNYPFKLMYYAAPWGTPPIESPVYSVDLPSCEDSALLHCTNLVGLEVLDLKGAALTDEGLRHLESISSLKRVSLSDTRTTPDGVRRLKEKLPNCAVWVDSDLGGPRKHFRQ